MVDKNSPIPLYYQVKEKIKEDIKNGIYKSNEKLPTEKEFENLFQVSRITIRKAIEDLVSEGVLIKRRGAGTIVQKEKVVDQMLNLLGFTEKMEAKDFTVTSQVLYSAIEPADHRIASELELTEEESVLVIKRLRLIDGMPLGVFTTYIPAILGISIEEDFSKSLFKIYDKYNIAPYCSDRTISAILLDKYNANLLESKKGQPALQLHFITFDNDYRPIECVDGVCRGDIYSYKMRSYRKN